MKDGKVAPQYSKIITEAYERRSESDYGVFVTFPKEDVEEMFDDMKDFLATVEKLIQSDE